MSLAPASRHHQPQAPAPRHLVKALVDRLGAAVLVLLAAPWLAIIALAIKLDDGGPVLHRERRLGQWGREFTVLHFRTTALRGRLDGGLTRVGAVLRRHGIEGLPQLLNVLRGDLSFVGPRAPEPGLRAGEWPATGPAMKPGLTAPWHGRATPRSGEDESRELQRYLRSWSLRSDLVILWHWLRDASGTPGHA